MAQNRKESKQTESPVTNSPDISNPLIPFVSSPLQRTSEYYPAEIESPQRMPNGANGNKSKRIALNEKESKRTEKNRKTGKEVAEYMPLRSHFAGLSSKSAANQLRESNKIQPKQQ